MNDDFKLAISYILSENKKAIEILIRENPGLVSQSFLKDVFFGDEIAHQFYIGDSLLHLASASHKVDFVKILLKNKSNPNSNASKRIATPLHYACDGVPEKSESSPQVKTIKLLIKEGADINAQDANGATPLHRAVRCRCYGAVKVLVEYGCLFQVKNKSGSTPLMLALVNSGKSGSGSDLAKESKNLIYSFLNKI